MADINKIIDEFRGQTGADIPIDEFLSRSGISVRELCDLGNARKVVLGNWASTLDRAKARFGSSLIVSRDGLNEPWDGRPLGRDDYVRGYVRIPQKSLDIRCCKCGDLISKE